MNADIELVSKALAEFNTVEAGLQALRERFTGIVFDVATAKGMDEAKAARLELREPRYEVERIRKAAKAPLLALGKKLDADAARITAEIEKLEGPIDQQIKAEEDRKEREKQAKIAAEAARVAAIQARITEIRAVVTLPFSSAALILDHIGDIEKIAVDESFAEFRDTAADAKTASIARLRELHAAAVDREVEQARIAAERAELARLRAEQAEREAAERARIAEEDRVARQAREAEAARRADELHQQREALAAQEREQQARIREESERLAREREEFTRQQEAARQAAELQEAARKASKRRKQRPTDDEIIRAVADHFRVPVETAAWWISTMQVTAEKAAC